MSLKMRGSVVVHSSYFPDEPKTAYTLAKVLTAYEYGTAARGPAASLTKATALQTDTIILILIKCLKQNAETVVSRSRHQISARRGTSKYHTNFLLRTVRV
jgi:hypothetical protein